MFIKRLLKHAPKEAAQPIRGAATAETEEAQRAVRSEMEADVARDRERRGATDVPPGLGASSEEKPVQG